MGELSFAGYLRGHSGWVTALATSPSVDDMVVSASRDKTLMIWKLEKDPYDYEKAGSPRRSLHGHSHFVSDVAISNDGQFAMSSSWDHDLRLWDLNTGESTRRFVGHKKDVLSVSFSPDNRQIVSGSRDKTIKLWNTLGECKYTMEDNGHTEWVSAVRFSPTTTGQLVVSCGWDKRVKVWDMTNCSLRSNLDKHTGYVNAVAVSPDSSLCASGGKDGRTVLWDLQEGTYLYALQAHGIVHALCFAPDRYWLCAATDSCVMVYDLESKTVVKELRDEDVDSSSRKASAPTCISLTWNATGSMLFGGFTDNVIRVWEISKGVQMSNDVQYANDVQYSQADDF